VIYHLNQYGCEKREVHKEMSDKLGAPSLWGRGEGIAEQCKNSSPYVLVVRRGRTKGGLCH